MLTAVMSSFRRLRILLVLLLLLAFPACTCQAAAPRLYAFISQGIRDKAIRNGVKEIEEVLETNQAFRLQKPITTFRYNYNARSHPEDRSKFLSKIKEAFAGASSSDYGFYYHVGHSGPKSKGSKQCGIYIHQKYDERPGTFVSFRDVAKALAKTRCKKIFVVVEACHAGAFISQGVRALPLKDRKRFLVLASCKSDEVCNYNGGEWDGPLIALFTHELHDALLKTPLSTDRNSDGVITLQEALKAVRPAALFYGFPQHAVSFSAGKNDIFYKYSRKKAAALPKPVKGTISLDKKTMTIEAGEGVFIKATVQGPSKGVIWGTSDMNVASVQVDYGIMGDVERGTALVWGYEPGTTIITATANGASATCKVIVKNSAWYRNGW